MEEIVYVTKSDVAKIIAQWWKEYAENPESFTSGPDSTGESSAETFFRLHKQLEIHNRH